MKFYPHEVFYKTYFDVLYRFLVGKDKVPIYAHIAIVAARSAFLRNKIKQARELSQDMNDADPPPAPSGAPSYHSVKVRENNILGTNFRLIKIVYLTSFLTLSQRLLFVIIQGILQHLF